MFYLYYQPTKDNYMYSDEVTQGGRVNPQGYIIKGRYES